jgi:hypothetical protein
MRIEEVGREHENGLSMWPSTHYRAWSNEEKVIGILDGFLPDKRRTTRRRR